MDAAQTEKLKALALAATQGKWITKLSRHIIPVEHAERRIGCSANEREDNAEFAHEICRVEGKYQPDRANADYIAAACPATVLELIADNERLRAEVERLTEGMEIAINGLQNIAAVEARSAPAAGTEEDAKRLLTAIVQSDVGISIRHKLQDGQGTATEDGKNWLAAIEFVAAAHAKARDGA